VAYCFIPGAGHHYKIGDDDDDPKLDVYRKTTFFHRMDGSHFGDQGLLQKVRKGRGTRVALTASPSSSVVEECVRLLRTLHSMNAWSNKINEYICLKLSLVRSHRLARYCH
jgi:hypothetical protein